MKIPDNITDAEAASLGISIVTTVGTNQEHWQLPKMY
jgi:hypothetical protein